MHVIFPLWMMTWSNTLVYSCECVCFIFCCFVLLFNLECIFLCVLCCLMFIDMFHIQMQLMQRQDRWNESVCMYVCMYVCMWEQRAQENVWTKDSKWQESIESCIICTAFKVLGKSKQGFQMGGLCGWNWRPEKKHIKLNWRMWRKQDFQKICIMSRWQDNTKCILKK